MKFKPQNPDKVQNCEIYIPQNFQYTVANQKRQVYIPNIF